MVTSNQQLFNLMLSAMIDDTHADEARRFVEDVASQDEETAHLQYMDRLWEYDDDHYGWRKEV